MYNNVKLNQSITSYLMAILMAADVNSRPRPIFVGRGLFLCPFGDDISSASVPSIRKAVGPDISYALGVYVFVESAGRAGFSAFTPSLCLAEAAFPASVYSGQSHQTVGFDDFTSYFFVEHYS